MERIVRTDDYMTHGEYEIFCALARLWHEGERVVRQADVRDMVNERREKRGGKHISWQNWRYHIMKFSKKPFVVREGKKIGLKEGLYKLVGQVPMCILIYPRGVIATLCPHTRDCDSVPFLQDCLHVSHLKK